GLGAQPMEVVRGAGPVLQRLTLSEAPRHLRLDVHAVVDGSLRDGAASPARDVSGGDVHVVRLRAGPAYGVEQLAGADDVGGERLVHRRVERHVPGTVHDRVEVGRQLGDGTQVTLQDLDPVVQQVVCSPG